MELDRHPWTLADVVVSLGRYPREGSELAGGPADET
jgi:hypothetical protein